jgi:exopolysaccharide biosynthesis WecB/TagA/CpsF family protein
VVTTAVAPEAPADRLAQLLAENLERGAGGTLTWLNHFSALKALEAGVPLHHFDYVGLDGILLCRLVKTECARTSADLLLPPLLQRTRGLRIALIGSTADTLRTVAAKIETTFGHTVVLMRDGYGELPEPAVLRLELQTAGVQLAIVGLGAPKQDFYVLDIATPGVLVATCGGWLDQFAGDTYYPAWAYPLRLNWLVRLVREPRRLWKRYTLDALRAVRSRQDLIDYVVGLGQRPLNAVARMAAPTPVDRRAA